MKQIRLSTPADRSRVIEIWKSAVNATHHFLLPKDKQEIEAQVIAFLPSIPLYLAINEQNQAMGFMLVTNGHMEALFIDACSRGNGVGRVLIEYALRFHPNLTTDVNEQNIQAIGFYEHLGFKRIGRSQLDGQGRAYPLIHLQHQASEEN